MEVLIRRVLTTLPITVEINILLGTATATMISRSTRLCLLMLLFFL